MINRSCLTSPDRQGIENAGIESKTVIVSNASRVGETPWSWVVIHQAIGMTMEYLGCSGLAAFEALIAQADARSQTVSDLSADVVERKFR